MYKMLLVCGALLVGLLSQRPALGELANQDSMSSSAATPTLDYEYFKTKVQPIFLNRRPGHARCIACHSSNNAPFRVVPLSPGATTWDEEQSQENFKLVKRVAFPGDLESPILIHPLAEKAGGDFFHSGGKHFDSKNNPEWQTLKEFVMGAKAE